MKPGTVFVQASQRIAGWWEVREVKPNRTEHLFAGPFQDRDRAEKLADRVNLSRATR